MYEDGIGVERDVRGAIEWFVKGMRGPQQSGDPSSDDGPREATGDVWAGYCAMNLGKLVQVSKETTRASDEQRDERRDEHANEQSESGLWSSDA